LINLASSKVSGMSFVELIVVLAVSATVVTISSKQFLQSKGYTAEAQRLLAVENTKMQLLLMLDCERTLSQTYHSCSRGTPETPLKVNLLSAKNTDLTANSPITLQSYCYRDGFAVFFPLYYGYGKNPAQIPVFSEDAMLSCPTKHFDLPRFWTPFQAINNIYPESMSRRPGIFPHHNVAELYCKTYGGQVSAQKNYYFKSPGNNGMWFWDKSKNRFAYTRASKRNRTYVFEINCVR
jgi:type II secretory pathway pseudopilin PulG